MITLRDFPDFSPFAYGQLTSYIAVNLLLTLGSFILLLYVYIRQRHLFLRPSMLLAGFFHIFLQWPLAMYAHFYEQWLPLPWHLVLAVHGGTLLPLALAFALPSRALLQCWHDLSEVHATPEKKDETIINQGLVLLGFLAAATLGYYFSFVPLRCTGIYAYGAYNEAAFLLRDFSLKLLDARPAAYAYTFYSTFISSLLFLFLLMKIRLCFAMKRYVQTAVFTGAIIITVLLGCLEASMFRYISYGTLFILYLLWTNRLAFSIRHGFVVGALGIALGGLCIMISVLNHAAATPERQAYISDVVAQCSRDLPVQPAARDLAWQQEQLGFVSKPVVTAEAPRSTVKTVIANQAPSIFNRIFVTPFMVGSWYFHYAQTQGPIGIAGIPRLAQALDTPSVATGNIIGLAYGRDYYDHAVSSTINASTGFLFMQYGCFGFKGILISFLLIALLDALIFVILLLPKTLLPVYMNTLTLICMNLIQSDFGYSLFSGGLLPATGIMLLLYFSGKHRYLIRRETQ